MHGVHQIIIQVQKDKQKWVHLELTHHARKSSKKEINEIHDFNVNKGKTLKKRLSVKREQLQIGQKVVDTMQGMKDAMIKMATTDEDLFVNCMDFVRNYMKKKLRKDEDDVFEFQTIMKENEKRFTGCWRSTKRYCKRR